MTGGSYLAGVVATVLVLAGCAGGGSSPAASSAPSTTAPPPAPTIDAGSISGTVLDEEQLPLASVRVALLETQGEVQSDAAGAFVFNEVPPGSYKLITERLGYESFGRSVDVVAGEVTQVQIILKAQAIAVEPVVRMTPFQGMIQCAFNPLYSFNPCHGVTGQDKNMFVFEIDKTIKLEEGIFELVWQPATAATAQSLELNVCDLVPDRNENLVCFDNNYNKYKTGPSPVSYRLTDIPYKTYPKFLTGAGSGLYSPSPVYQQSFMLYMTLCYIEPCADEYSAIPPP